MRRRLGRPVAPFRRNELAALCFLLPEVTQRLDARHSSTGYNVGQAAGQTVGHVHVHLIPRYAGDVEDPRGGVRWVVPARAAYWKASP